MYSVGSALLQNTEEKQDSTDSFSLQKTSHWVQTIKTIILEVNYFYHSSSNSSVEVN